MNVQALPEHSNSRRVVVLTTAPLAVFEDYPEDVREVIDCPHCSEPITLGIGTTEAVRLWDELDAIFAAAAHSDAALYNAVRQAAHRLHPERTWS